MVGGVFKLCLCSKCWLICVCVNVFECFCFLFCLIDLVIKLVELSIEINWLGLMKWWSMVLLVSFFLKCIGICLNNLIVIVVFKCCWMVVCVSCLLVVLISFVVEIKLFLLCNLCSEIRFKSLIMFFVIFLKCWYCLI